MLVLQELTYDHCATLRSNYFTFNSLCYVMLCYAMLCYVMLCYAMLCYAMLCYAMLRYAMLCYAMLCCAMLCYVMLYMLRFPQSLKLCTDGMIILLSFFFQQSLRRVDSDDSQWVGATDHTLHPLRPLIHTQAQAEAGFQMAVKSSLQKARK